MSDHSPFFSVIIPTYNRANSILRSIESVLNQTFQNFEIIVVDDGSTDNTSEIIKPLLSDKTKYFLQGNNGVSGARNYGAEKASGLYLIFLDSDDWFADEALTNLCDACMRSRADIVHSSAQFTFRDGRVKVKNVFQPYENKRLSKKGLQMTGTFCLKKEVFWRIGGYDNQLSYGENTELFWRLYSAHVSSFIIEVITVNIYRDRPTRTSTSSLNLITSINRILSKHSHLMNSTPHMHWLYLNRLGVAHLRLNHKLEAMQNFVKAIWVKPFRHKSYLRLLGSVFNYTKYVGR